MIRAAQQQVHRQQQQQIKDPSKSCKSKTALSDMPDKLASSNGEDDSSGLPLSPPLQQQQQVQEEAHQTASEYKAATSDVPDELAASNVEVDFNSPLSWGSFKSAYKGNIGDTAVSVLKFRFSEHDPAVVRAAAREVEMLMLLPKHPNL